ncbi:hypothetical protein [Bacillus cereus group sp. N21]|uniref:hypothetical protein n=1 Tax=Bacillus cereus group sp. N21 TaxID=2794591 RepID=UPI0018F36E04|nr:hypothetical protein [Bacillus cereus group sp. N21]MBJ8031401.1 hypothetical protein [Bacillus cereus group sp. N21]
MFGEIIKSKPLVLQSHRYKIDPNKIQTLDDVIQILRRVDMHVDDKGVKGIEHLIAENND